jgi:6,7-dimethyl-8-ribityllumazine synthase
MCESNQEKNMPKTLEGKLIAQGKKFALIASRFNDFITDRLVGGALDALIRCGADDADIEIVKVPGAFEIPLIMLCAIESFRSDFNFT